MNTPQSQRLQKRHEFARVERRGVRIHAHYFILIALRSYAHPQGRAGMTVSKKLGKSHERNFMKRRIRHLLQKHRSLLEHLQLVVIGKPPLATDDFAKIEKSFIQAMQQVKQQLNRQRPSPKDAS